MTEPACSGCGKRPEVYGSSWCSWCHDHIPRAAQVRIITMRNALFDIARGHPRFREIEPGEFAEQVLRSVHTSEVRHADP